MGSIDEYSQYASVIVDISADALDRPFTYRIPPNLSGRVLPGVRVEIPFNKKTIFGYVTELKAVCDFPPERVRDILAVAAGAETAESRLVALAAWMSRTYGGRMLESLRTVFPVRRRIAAVTVRYVYLTDRGRIPAYISKLSSRQMSRRRVLESLLLEDGQMADRLMEEQEAGPSILKGLEKDGMIVITQSEQLRRLTESVEEARKDELTPEQAAAVRKIRGEWTARVPVTAETAAPDEARPPEAFAETEASRVHDRPPSAKAAAIPNEARLPETVSQTDRPVLLTGITGSGKTLVYMELIADELAAGRQAIVLIPEIALTDQTVRRFVARFGDKVSFLHSRLSDGERYDQMRAAKSGEISVMVGPRSALFAPFANLGIIVIDEEHEGSYRSERTPRYDARETAAERARLEGAHLLLGSATPSVESAFAAAKGEYLGVELTKRFGDARLPETLIVDMRREMMEGNHSIFSEALRARLESVLANGEQAMLFLNRRGYEGCVCCRSCGHVVKCPHCDVSLTLHNDGRLRCHYCGYEAPNIRACPSCGSALIGGLSIGTQKVEAMAAKAFPGARILRMDLDTTKGKEGHKKILAAFAEGQADILLGTQMIVKGHDFPNVTLVGALMADLSLQAPDFRSGERTYALLAQAIGRAGRGEKPGTAIIQTYQPDHYAIRCAAAQDYGPFFREEIAFRELMGYPPCGRLLAILGSAEDESLLSTAMDYLRKYIGRIDPANALRALGPAPQSVGKVKDRYRQVIYLRHERSEALIRARKLLERYLEINRGFEKVRVEFDMNG